MTTADQGTADIIVADLKNRLHAAEGKVLVIPPTRIEFGDSVVEAEVNNELELPLEIFGTAHGKNFFFLNEGHELIKKLFFFIS